MHHLVFQNITPSRVSNLHGRTALFLKLVEELVPDPGPVFVTQTLVVYNDGDAGDDGEILV